MSASLIDRVRWKLGLPSREAVSSSFYIDKYARADLGTDDQLSAGYRDQLRPEATPPELLDRLLTAWEAMQADGQDVAVGYRVSGEWTAIISQAFEPLTTALDSKDHRTLDELLRNFFRRFGDFFGEPTNLASSAYRRARQEQFRLYASRWIDLYGEDEFAKLSAPVVSNPIGFLVNGSFLTPDTFRHNFYARRMADLVDDVERPVVCEVGGGFGGFAYHLLGQARPSFRYLDYDLPVTCIAAAYYLSTARPEKTLKLYGEVASLQRPVDDCDIAILPNFALSALADASADICFNTCSFAEMSPESVQEYTRQFERTSRRFILYEDHSWSGDSEHAYYEPMGGFRHWDLSAVQPSPTLFKRLYKIPSPFHSDFLAEFFEWLYVRRDGQPVSRG